MLFNSIDFAIFLPLVFAVYWGLNKAGLKLQNMLILIASYVFYGWWDWRFLALIIFSTLVDYTVGQKLENAKDSHRKLLLWTSIIVNLGLLGFFKYYNFFLDNFIEAFSFFGQEISPNSLNIILPVGISFYTFQTLSYTIDVYRKKLKPSSDLIAFGAYVAFFPQLVAGPIERATNLLPQFATKKTFNYSQAVDGMRQILWGLFKKVVIADNCAVFANEIFNNSDQYSGATLFLGGAFFAFQIYGDFSGYSDIAIGTARLFGFNLMQNFAFPYFSRDIAEFWRRWHISLSTWFRDYLYIPLGGSKGTKSKVIRNVFIIFLVSGFWHGANWTFVVWGALNAVYFLPLLLRGKNRKNTDIVAQGKHLPSIKEFVAMGLTFCMTVVAWIFFRADNLTHATSYLYGMAAGIKDPINSFKMAWDTFHFHDSSITIYLLLFFILIEWVGRSGQFALEKIGINWRPIFRRSFYIMIALTIFLFGQKQADFIYFQF